MIKLKELALNIDKAIDRANSLGKQFVKHFHKVYVEGISSRDFHHHCKELQTFWEDVCSIRLKTNNKLVPMSYINDWFFTVGKSVEDLFDDENEQDVYEVFMKKLDRGDNVKELLLKILNNP